MAYVIAEPCIGTKDTACADACPVDCIHPKKGEDGNEGAEQLFIDPGGVHRLRRVRSGLPGFRHLRGRRSAGQVGRVLHEECGALRPVVLPDPFKRTRSFGCAFLSCDRGLPRNAEISRTWHACDGSYDAHRLLV